MIFVENIFLMGIFPGKLLVWKNLTVKANSCPNRHRVSGMARIVLCHIMLSSVGLCRGQVQPEMAREVCLSTLVHTWRGVAWEGCLRLLLLWIRHDLQPPFFTPVRSHNVILLLIGPTINILKSVCRSSQTAGRNSCSIVSGDV